MRFSKRLRSIRQLSTHVLAVILGVLLTVGTLQVSPSQAEPAPSSVSAASPQLIAQKSPATAAIGSSSFVTAAVNRVGPAVVRIDTERTITRRSDPFFDDPFFRRFFGNGSPQQLPPEQLRGLGSGFIIDKSGLILTNAHVVDKADKVTVRLKDGRSFEGKVQGVDEVTDLAVVKINAGADLPIAPLGSSTKVQVGDWAIAVGNPLGLDNTVTLGIISTLRRSSSVVGIGNKRLDFIQTDAAINPGNSGGPLVNAQGEVIGINTAIRGDATGIGFAIPIDKAKTVATKLERGETIAHPFIGVQMQEITPELARQFNSNPNSPIQLPEIDGVLVMQVVPNSPAATAGIRPGDVILEVDRQPITKGTQLLDIVENSRVGQQLQLKVQRGNRTQQLSIRTVQLQNPS
ncbi:MAG: trypsin-like peptidase domain-containing protein [Brasilonema octagenarum HA4186-MV1]|uniref:Serine protease n=2 Tax=Brasilonema TaxID=383614 RepID=A0A856MDD2_9CYAN|nr:MULTISPECIES: HhoA/HhoB/HtrA family serine endopeptidase [Brasilonema]MBW4626709.1 trypsin-like peptidase domain-containing protein [Brasilonema octagenarum HA4186-MV1]NMF64472.1 serine protease [Brasilonema octagenarum UFV-OR1]QDL07711.1 serine protease [Brasilonema sennae CENA114]QDL14073.1 serine protease [Brasilonema octagenarum UFV-E1]